MARIHTLSDASEASRAPVRLERQRMTTAMPRKAIATSGSTGPVPSTVDPTEIARFAALAESWWDPAGKFKPLHRLNPVRLGFLRNRLTAHFARDPAALRPFDGLRLLDIGCGGGLVAEPMARLGFAVTGVDAGAETIATARAHAQQGGLAIDYRAIAAETLVDSGERFDVVLALEIVEHVADLGVFVAAAAALVRPGGALIVATLNRTVKSYLFAIIGAEYVLGWLPRGTHEWRKFVRPSELAALLRRNRLRIEEIAGVTYNPLADSWALSTDLDVNYMAFAAG
jgi:2-polyprenyl-6-hydroxyphenyl methylase / 3-demethylubiquinone-9 3-methyltransferase